MNLPRGLGLVLSALAAATWLVAVEQRKELHALRGRQAAPARTEESPGSAEMPPDATGEPATIHATARPELLALRAEVTSLQERKRRGAEWSAEHRLLKARLERIRREPSGLPPNYVRRADAKNRGRSTPEATLETLLWALQTGDTNAFISLMREQERGVIAEQIARQGGAAGMQKAYPLPGFRVVGRQDQAPDEVTLEVELAPGFPMPMQFRRENEAWVMKF